MDPETDQPFHPLSHPSIKGLGHWPGWSVGPGKVAVQVTSIMLTYYVISSQNHSQALETLNTLF